MRAFDFAARAHWAIQTEIDEDGTVRAPALKNILDIALRAKEPDFEAVAQKMAERVDEEGVMEMRGSVAVLNVAGPIFRYANLFTWISGATSVQELATAFRSAVDDPAVTGIVLNVDSPGGEVAGIGELATAIYEARGKKPIVAYADDQTASAAYWLASSADRIVASDTAELGSIGVVATMVDRGPRDGVKTYQFVSSQSPNKRPNPETDAGRATIQQRVDDLAAVFVAAVARNRGVSEDKVLAEFGMGGMMIASKAVAAGMADATGNFEAVVAELGAQEVRPGGLMKIAKGATSMKTPEQLAAETAAAEKTQAEAVAEAKAAGIAQGIIEGRKLERARWGAILGSEEAKERPVLAQSIAAETELDVEGARKVLAKGAIETKPASNALAAAMATLPNPKVGTAGAGGELDEEAEIAAVVAAGKTARGGK